MLNFKISVSKDGKKYNIVMKAENQSAVRDRVHKEWYSILSIEEIFDKSEIWDTFIFEWYKWWEFKHWKIVWNDIFKSYIKLRKELEYDISFIYSEKDENLATEDKKKIIEELKEEYELFIFSNKNTKNDAKVEKIKKEKEKIEINIDNKLDNFYLKKELFDVNTLLEKVLFKLDKMLSNEYNINIDSNKKDKLKLIYNEIIKLKKSTNIYKLKQVWELALLKIWKIELDELEKNKKLENRLLLKDTNSLLKKLWSKDQFIEKDRDLWYQLKYIISRLNTFFSNIKNMKKKESIDKESHSYIKNLLYLSKYKDLYKENTKKIIINFYKFLFNKELKDELLLSRSVIRQNIILLKAKEKWVNISYTYLKKWISKIVEYFFNFFTYLWKIAFVTIIFYVIIFLFYINLTNFVWYNYFWYNWIFYFIILSLFYIIIWISRNLLFLTINFVILFFIIIFGVINF